MPLLLVACFALSVHGQSSAAPASSASVPTLYQRPNNSDCVASASGSTNYFPLQFQIVGSSPAEEDRVNVREQRICSASCQAPRASLTLTLTALRSLWRKTSLCSTWTRTRWPLMVQLLDVHWLALKACLKTGSHTGAGSDEFVCQRDVYLVPMWNKSAIS